MKNRAIRELSPKQARHVRRLQRLRSAKGVPRDSVGKGDTGGTRRVELERKRNRRGNWRRGEHNVKKKNLVLSVKNTDTMRKQGSPVSGIQRSIQFQRCIHILSLVENGEDGLSKARCVGKKTTPAASSGDGLGAG